MIIHEDILVHSPIERVWQVFTDLSRWKAWNTVMRDVRTTNSVLAANTAFTCRFRPFLVVPIEMEIEIKRVLPLEKIEWSTKKTGLRAHHEFSFEEREGGVLVSSTEEFSGFFAAASGLLLPVGKMRELTAIFLEDLKKASRT